DGDLLREVAVCDRGRDVGDVAYLVREVAGERIDVVRQLLPHAAHPGDVGLPAELALRTHFLGDARDLGGERAELVDHRVDGVLHLGDLAPDVDRDLLGEVAVRDCGGDLRDVPDLRRQVRGERVDVVGQVLPDARNALHARLAAELAVG